MNKYIIISISILAVLIIGVLFFIPKGTQIQQPIDNSNSYVPLQKATQWIIPTSPTIISQNTVTSNDVYIDDNHVSIIVSPAVSNTPIISVTPKDYSGSVDVVVGFNTNQATPTGAYFNPQITQIQKSYTCNGFFNYTTSPKHFWCYNIQANGTTLTYEHDFTSGNLSSGTAYWYENQTTWHDVSGPFSKIDYNYDGFNQWYYVKGFNVTTGNTYQLKLQIQQHGMEGYKYFFGIKPSSETFQQAISNGHFYYIDPWTEGLNSGLVSYYKFDENSGTSTADSLGLYNGTLSNLSTTAWIAGKINYSVNFTDGNVSLGNASGLDGVGGNTITFAGWVYPVVNGNYPTIFGAYDGGTIEYIYGLYSTTGKIGFCYGAGCTWQTSNTSLTLNTWNFIAMAIDGGTYTFYLNGNPDGTGILPAGWSHANNKYFAYIGTNDHFEGIIDEFGIWNRSLSASEITQLYNGGTGISYTNIFSPTVVSIEPENLSNFIKGEVINFTVNASASSSSINITNVTINIYNSSGIYYSNTNTSGDSGIYYWNLTGIPKESYNWTSYAYGTDNNTYTTSNGTLNFSVSDYIINSLTYDSTTAETAQESFAMNITTNGSTLSNGGLIYNGTYYPSTITNIAGNNYNISKTIQIPIGVTNNSFYFNFSLGGVTYTSSTNNQTVNLTYFTSCNTTYPYPFLNITFKDESTLTAINASIPSSTFTYYLGDGSITKNYTFSNTSNNYNYTFCSTPNRTVYVEPNVQYKQGSAYPQRTWSPVTQSYNQTVTSQILYLLSSSNGIYVTFQVINSAEQALSGVATNITSSIGGSDVLISSVTTGADGGATYWLNPDNFYTANFYLSPYPLYSLYQQFTQTGYTVQLGSSSSSNATDYSRGITYLIQPTDYSLVNGTSYNFNFSINSIYYSLDGFGFNLTNGTIVYGSASSASPTGGTINVNMNTSDNSTIYMNYYWTINSTNFSGSYTWVIIQSGSSYSISNWVSDFKSYLSLGFFGLDNFGTGLIVFLIIVLVVGITKSKWGISDTAVTLGLIWSLVAFFDISLGLIPNPINAVSHFPTIFMGIIFLSILFKEAYQ